MKIKKSHYINLSKVWKLNKTKRKEVMSLYRDMVFTDSEDVFTCIFNTLLHNDFLVDIRSEKIDKINGDLAVDN